MGEKMLTFSAFQVENAFEHARFQRFALVGIFLRIRSIVGFPFFFGRSSIALNWIQRHQVVMMKRFVDTQSSIVVCLNDTCMPKHIFSFKLLVSVLSQTQSSIHATCVYSRDSVPGCL